MPNAGRDLRRLQQDCTAPAVAALTLDRPWAWASSARLAVPLLDPPWMRKSRSIPQGPGPQNAAAPNRVQVLVACRTYAVAMHQKARKLIDCLRQTTVRIDQGTESCLGPWQQTNTGESSPGTNTLALLLKAPVRLPDASLPDCSAIPPEDWLSRVAQPLPQT
jgi:hypothetical protein